MGQATECAVAVERPMTATETTVARVWAAELRLPRIGLDEDFIDLGSHSLQGLAIAESLEQIFGIAIPVRTLFEEPTVTDLAAWIDQRRGAPQEPLAEVIRLQAAEGSPLRPIFALPGGRGDAAQLYALAKLAREIDPARPMHGFPGDPPVPESTPRETWIAAAATAVVARMRTIQPTGPYLVLGVCAGGVIAWEATRQLEEAGETVHLLLVDTRNPQWDGGEGTFRHAVTETLSPAERRTRHRQRREWRRRKGDGVAPPGMEVADEERVTRRMVMTRAYRPRPLAGRVTLLVNGDWHQVGPTLGWDGLAAGGIEVGVTERGHALGWHIPEVATYTRRWLANVEQGTPISMGDARAEAAPSVVADDPPALERPSVATETPPANQTAALDEEPSWPSATVIDALTRWAEQTPDAAALLGADGEVLDYRRLRVEVERLAETMCGFGVGRDDIVLIALPDGPDMALAILASMTAGIAAPVSSEMTEHEFAGVMGDRIASAVVLPAGAQSPARAAAVAAGLPVFEMAFAPPAPRAIRLTGPAIGPPAKVRRPKPDDIALIISSSGTTGRPKRIPRTHRNIATTSADVGRVMNIDRDRCLNLAPMAFSQGLNALLNTLWAGGSVIALPGFELARLPERIATFRPTWFSATPTVLRAIAMNDAASAAVRACSPRLIRASAGAISADEVRLLEERFRAPVLHSYGMSEASFISGEPTGAGQRKLGSAGFANHEVRFLGDDGHPLPPGETGEIVVRGPNVFPGYLDDPVANAAGFLPDGWFRTGDVGYVDTDGFLFVTGRLKEMIKRGGVAIGPLEIEEALLTDPAVAEACVFAVPHPELGEDVAAAIVLRPGAVATERGVRDQVAALLSPPKVPRHIVFVTAIPRTATGKPRRGELAAAVAPLLAPAAEEYQSGAGSGTPDGLVASVAEIWAGVLDRGPVANSDDLFDLGADSLQIARIQVALEQRFATELPAGLLFAERTPARVVAWIAGHVAASPPVAAVAGMTPPLFFVSSAGGRGRNSLRASRLGSAIDPERQVHDLVVPQRLLEAAPEDPDEVFRTARSCVETARREQPSGPYRVVGLAEGGVIAHEMARQWENAGETVHLLLIESWNQAAAADGHDGQSAVPGDPFGGFVTLIATRGELEKDPALGWGNVFGAGLRVVPIVWHERPRRMQLEIAGAVRAWLAEVEGCRDSRPR
jgi:acyl-CoA synthetase (AMP-forming)/AMP-acid ligase II/thioesterase domain-containing protein/acyl carrier protein